MGKGTLIEGLQQRLGFFQTVHYEKPKALSCYNDSLEMYQRESFKKMFSMLEQGGMLLDRAHLGETVYSPRYRKYDGSYVYDMERQHPTVLNNTLLILLTASNWDPVKDDGESFNFNAKCAEQIDFFKAWERSHIRHKLLIDVTYERGFVPPKLILDAAVSAYNKLASMPMTIMCTSWEGDSNENLTVHNDLRTDPKATITEG